MSLAMINKVFGMTAKTTALQRLVLLALADCHNEKSGKCFPSYDTLARKVGTDKRSVVRTIKELADKSLIHRIKFRKRNGIGYGYIILPTQTVDTPTIDTPTIDEMSTDERSTQEMTSGQLNHTRLVNLTGIKLEENGNTYAGDTPATPASHRFVKPTEDDVRAYCTEMGYDNVDAGAFIDYYESKGWVVGKTPMKDWKASVRTWNRNGRCKYIKAEPTFKQDGYTIRLGKEFR